MFSLQNLPLSCRQWRAQAEQLRPPLGRRMVLPQRIQVGGGDWAAAEWRQLRLLKGDRISFDFGEEIVGSASVALDTKDCYDAPLRVVLYFTELEASIAKIDQPVRTGGLSASWVQREVCTLDLLPAVLKLPRRFAFRFLTVEIEAFNANRVQLGEVVAETVTSAGKPLPAPAGLDGELADIDRVSVATLRACMQEVFEDGPKRDRRLWLGDLRLEALTNAVTFRKFRLAERCLYMLAGEADGQGRIPACVYDRPQMRHGNDIIDYSLLFGPMLLDHLKFYGREAVVRALFELSCHQLDLVRPYFAADGSVSMDKIPLWVFIDHRPELRKEAALTGVYLYSLRQHAELSRRLKDLRLAAAFDEEAARLSAKARKQYWNAGSGKVLSCGQHSYASVIWAVLGGMLSPEEGRRAIAAVRSDPLAVRPATPYLWHHMVEAMRCCGLEGEALELIRFYWGGMVRAGALTFWEVFDPEQPGYSPNGDIRLNSYCHSWSSTPAYFLRKPCCTG